MPNFIFIAYEIEQINFVQVGNLFKDLLITETDMFMYIGKYVVYRRSLKTKFFISYFYFIHSAFKDSSCYLLVEGKNHSKAFKINFSKSVSAQKFFQIWIQRTKINNNWYKKLILLSLYFINFFCTLI